MRTCRRTRSGTHGKSRLCAQREPIERAVIVIVIERKETYLKRERERDMTRERETHVPRERETRQEEDRHIREVKMRREIKMRRDIDERKDR